MPYCPNCGDQMKDEHFYCGSCGYPLSDEVEDDDDQRPPSGTAASRQGFLSGRSEQYLIDVLDGDEELDSDKHGYSNLSRDVGAALADFAVLAAVEDINLLALVADNSTSTDLVDKDPVNLTRSERRDRLMWTGLFRVPELYDQSFGTEWRDDLSEQMTDLVEHVEQFKQGNESE